MTINEALKYINEMRNCDGLSPKKGKGKLWQALCVLSDEFKKLQAEVKTLQHKVSVYTETEDLLDRTHGARKSIR